jgi:hypothetical protein
MADPTDAPNPDDDIRTALAARERDLAIAQARMSAMEETFNALKPQPQQQMPLQPAPGKHYVIPPQIRQQIIAAGISDADLEANADLIVPFIHAYLGAAASEMLSVVQQQADEITQLQMLRDVQQYPHADALYSEMSKIRKSEAQQGRYLNPETAYRLAVANNYEKLGGAGGDGGQFSAPAQSPPPTSPVAARSRDAAAGNIFRTVRAPVTAPESTPTKGDDLMEMTREQRRAFFEQHGQTPIR